jgi:misacylated tRNA(Ala) deacylase
MTSTILLYQTDAYLKEFPAKVTIIDQDQRGVILNQSAFYPGGGGQQADFGMIVQNSRNYPVLAMRRTENGPLHILGGSEPLPDVGDQVTGYIDWDRRYANMRTHTAMHILCGVVFRDYGALVTGGEMEPLKGRMDFEFETLQKELIGDIENAVQKEVEAMRTVRTRILPREEAFAIPDLIRTKISLLPGGISEVRIVEIEGLDIQADGGTHVHNTSEVGNIHVTDYKSKGKINKRIYVEIS